jgi:hypothetical protein
MQASHHPLLLHVKRLVLQLQYLSIGYSIPYYTQEESSQIKCSKNNQKNAISFQSANFINHYSTLAR